MEPDATDSSPPVPGVGDAAITPITLPAGFTCPKCDYDLGGASVQVCSECGRGIESADLESFELFVFAIRNERLELKRFWRRAAVIVMAVGGVAMVLSISIAITLVAIALSAGALLASLGVGWAAAAAASRRDRPAIRRAWVIAVFWLNGPWLLWPVFALGGLTMVIFTAKLSGPSSPGQFSIVPTGFGGLGVWTLLCIISVVLGVGRLSIRLKECNV